MNLSPLYELRERLAGSGIAGVNLIKEDFRLSRAIEALEPLAKAAPVFQKIYDTAKEAIKPECENPTGVLLDALALVDAVIYTQGITETKKEPEKILFGKVKEYQNISYSVLTPLLEALTTTGSQRLEIVKEVYQNHPEYLNDYRVFYAFVGALSDNYTELAEQVEEILCKEDETIIPILKKELSLKELATGAEKKKGMQRYVHVIEAIAKEKENDYYLYLAEEATKGVKQAAIEALRHSKENVEYLLRLVKTERGANKKAAQYALSFLESPEIFSYWEKEIKKSPDSVKEFLRFSSVREVSDIIAKGWIELLKQILEKKEITEEEFLNLYAYGEMLLGKDTEAICEGYEFLAKEEKNFEKIIAPKQIRKDEHTINYYGYSYSALSVGQKRQYSIAQIFREKLLENLLYQESPALIKLIEKLYKTYGKSYAPHAFLGALLQKKKEDVYEEFAPLIDEKVKMRIEQEEGKEKGKGDNSCFFNILGRIQYDEKNDSHYLYQPFFDYKTSKLIPCRRPLKEKLDEKWYLFLTDSKLNKSKTFYYTYDNENLNRQYYYGYNQYDAMLVNITDIHSSNSRKIVGNYIYERTLQLGEKEEKGNQIYSYYEWLRYLKWENKQGMLVAYLKKKKNHTFWDIKRKLEILGFTNEQFQKELEQIIEAINKGEISLNDRDRDSFLKYYETSKNTTIS
ncbi:MAG: hypothetical protein HFI05_07400 [Lachnospiraceae bacterium]|jgi:hypothetical protein|nr:hypothetical protein [Lachnospiraceae bacterium]